MRPPLTVTVDTSLKSPPETDSTTFLTWDAVNSSSNKVRFLVPTNVYRPGSLTSEAPPKDYLTYPRGLTRHGVTLSRVVKITVDGHPATLMTATSGPAAVPPGFFDGTVGCPDPADDKEEACFGIQPEWLLQLAVIPVGKTTLLAWALLAPGELIPPHTHAHEDQCICIVSGALCLQIGDELIQAPAGSYVIKPRGLPHAFWNPGTTLARVLEITSPGGFEPYYDEMAAVTSPEQALAVQAKYGITFHGDHAVELISHHGLRVGNIPQSWR